MKTMTRISYLFYIGNDRLAKIRGSAGTKQIPSDHRARPPGLQHDLGETLTLERRVGNRVSYARTLQSTRVIQE